MTASQCPSCGKELEEGVRFCPHDGTPLTVSTASAPTATPAEKGTQKVQLQLPVVVGNRYRLEQFLGGGGMARVYRGTDLTLEREVAVKLISPELRAEPEFDARFQREARIASQLTDPHSVVVHDFGIDPMHGPYLVMEYLRGQSLRQRLQSDGVLPLKAVLQLGGQILLALIHAHEKGIVHRDIKPDNIFLLNQSGVRLHVRVLDFGIARIFRDDTPGAAEPLTHPGSVMGTPRYMSPEQLAGQPVDARSDLYSAAVVIYETLTGQLPYATGKRLCELCLEATPALQELLESCLKPDPNMRPASALEAYLRLQELGKASGVLLLPPGAMERLVAARKSQTAAQDPTIVYKPPVAWWRKRSTRAVLVTVVAVLAVGSSLILLKKLTGPPAKPERESVLGLEIGGSRDALIARMGEAPAASGLLKQKAWAELGHVLKPSDFGKDPAAQEKLEVLLWPDRHAYAVVEQNTIRALVTRAAKSASGRGLRVGDSLRQLDDLYGEEVAHEEGFRTVAGEGPDTPAGVPGKLYRYDNLGIGFEVVGGKVTAITLYPAQPGS